MPKPKSIGLYFGGNQNFPLYSHITLIEKVNVRIYFDMDTLFVKNMVCNRCILVVESELRRMGFDIKSVSLGEVQLNQELSEVQKKQISESLNTFGFELINDKKSRLIEQIKTLIIDLIHHADDEKLRVNLSDYLSEKLNHEYSYLSNLFSKIEGITLERYFILQKVERVKELLVYDELTLGEIAFQMNYSSAAHLSNQFKKVTGLSPSHFRQIRIDKRTPLDKI